MLHDPGSSLTANLEQQDCTAMSKSNSEERRTHSSWEHLDVSFIQEAMEEEMKKGRHLEMRRIFSSPDETFSMSMPQLKEKLLLAANPRPHWFWKAMHEE